MGRRGLLLAAATAAALLIVLLWRRDAPRRSLVRGGEAAEPSPEAVARSSPEDPEPEAAAGRNVVAGRVVDGSGAPVEAATVAVIPGGTDGSTDAEGRFEIDGRFDGLVRCAATAPGFRMALGPWLPFEGERLDAGTIRLARGLRLTGRVVDPEGVGVAGAEIRLQREGAPSEEWEALLWQFGFADTDTDGRFVFDGVDAAPFRISLWVFDVDADDYVRRTREHVRAGDEVVFVVPVSSRPVAGTISVLVTLPDGTPLPRGNLAAGAGDGGAMDRIVDGKGEVTIEGTGKTWIVVFDPEDEHQVRLPYRPALRVGVTPRAEPYAITFEPGEEIDGIVVTRDDLPLPASVSLLPSRVDRDAPLMGLVGLNEDVVAGTDGRFRFPGLVPGEYSLRASLAGYSCSRPVIGVRSGDRDVRIEMRRAGSVTLRVLAPEGELLGGGSFRVFLLTPSGEVECASKTVSVGGNSGSSSIETTFDELTEGEIYRLRASVNGCGYGRYAPVAVDAVARTGPAVEVVLRRGRTLAGRVLRVDDSPVANAEVRVRFPAPLGLDEESRRAADYGQEVATSGLDGRFVMHGLPEQTFWLTCEATGLVQPEGPVGVTPGAKEVELRMAPALEVSGRIAGEPPLDFWIQWTPDVLAGDAAAIPREWEPSDTDGFFTLRALPPGTLTIDAWRPRAEDDDRYVHAEGLTAGTSDLRLPVLQGCRLEGTVEDRDGRPIPMARVFVSAAFGERAATTDDNGRFVLHALPPGRHLVRVATRQGPGEAVAVDAPGPPIRLVR